MTVRDLKPTRVWEIFDDITKVPRPSGRLDKIRKWRYYVKNIFF